MKILFVNHTFPPDSYAGSELCVLSLAQAMKTAGHQTAVFYRTNDPNRDDCDVVSGVFEGIPVYTINNTFRFAHTFQSIYLNSAIAARFAYLLREFEPDVVHFHHLTNLSLSLVMEAKAYGSAVVVTLHDYWLLCQRGQLLKRDMTLCHGPTDDGCRSCLALQLLRGNTQRVIAKLLKKRRFSREAENTAIDLLNSNRARIVTPNRDFVSRTSFTMGDGEGETLLAHPPAEITYPLALQQSATLQTAIAMHPATYTQPGGGVRFEIERNGQIVFSQTLNPKRERSGEGWHPVSIPLEPTTQPDERLTLRTIAEFAPDNSFCTAGWRNPKIQWPKPVSEFPARFDERLDEITTLLSRATALFADAIAACSPRAAEGISHRKNWVRRVLNETDLFISPSRFLRDFFIRHGLPPEKILFSDNGFVIPPAIKRQPSNKPLVFGYIGTWIPSKGVDGLLRAFRDIDPAEARLIVYGFFPGYDGFEDYESRLRALAGPAVEFAGKYDPSDVYSLLERIDCLLMPSIWWENSPMTIHEAFLAGVPVVTADVGGMAEQVREGGGVTFRHRDADDLHRVIRRIITDPAILDGLRKSIPHVKSVAAHAEELLSVYQTIMESSGKG